MYYYTEAMKVKLVFFKKNVIFGVKNLWDMIGWWVGL